MNEDQLRIRFPNASSAFILANVSAEAGHPAPRPVVERAPRARPLAARKAEGPNPTRVLVRVTSFRRRLLDEDNLAEKYFCDCARYAGLLQGDSPAEAQIEARQVKVARKENERTEVEISEMK